MTIKRIFDTRETSGTTRTRGAVSVVALASAFACVLTSSACAPTDPSERIIDDALTAAERVYGPAAIPVNRVHVQYDTGPTNFTYMLDEKKGVFAIVLTAKPDEDGFYHACAHEAAHLLNQKLADAYMEGLCSVFSEEHCRNKGYEWESTRKFFSLQRNFDAETYAMMSEIRSKVKPNSFRGILQYATDSHDGSMHIDIDRWLASLSPQEQSDVLEIISRHKDAIESTIPAYYTQHASVFTLPSKLKPPHTVLDH